MQVGMTPNEQVNLPRHEQWRLEYRRRPYLAEASDSALDQRFKDVINNLATLTYEGKVGILPIGPEGIPWMILFTHILEEYERRKLNYPSGEDMPFPKPTATDLPKSVAALEKIQMPHRGQALVKLGKRNHMQELYEIGKIRISPAASYSDPSLNFAMRDDELKIEQITPGSEVTLTYQDQRSGEQRTTKPIGEVIYTNSLATNYFVYCMSHTLSYRLFDDFEADSCVIIREPEVFGSRFLEVVKTHLPDWLDWNQEVEYIDPYLHRKEEIDLVFSKHFRYWYQQEYRFSWLPGTGAQTNLEAFFVELGSLKEISEFVSL